MTGGQTMTRCLMLAAVLCLWTSPILADPIHDAAMAGDVERIEALLKAGAKVNARERDKWKETPLHKAAWSGHTDAIEALLRAGANVNAGIKTGSTPL